MKQFIAVTTALVFSLCALGCATTPKPITDDPFMHKEAMEDMDKQLDKDKEEEKKKRESGPNRS